MNSVMINFVGTRVLLLLVLSLAVASPTAAESLFYTGPLINLRSGPGNLPVKMVDVEVRGQVTDQNGQPIPGATVFVEGTSIGVATDLDGNYTLTVPEGAILVFSFIGFESQRVPVGQQSLINVVLVEDMASLDEVVVVGYGTMQKRHLTGAVGSVKMDEVLSSRPVVDFGQAMYGKVAGVQIMKPSGRPGESSRIQIRGINSLSAGNEPLIVVDGVPLPDFDLNSINAADIESIDILKDASSAAIYGSRGANGVVLVTTKSGKAGEPQLHVNYTFTSQRVMNKVAVMNGPEYAQAAIEAAQNGWVNSGGDPNAPNTIEARGHYRYTWPEALEHPETLWDTDFQDLIYRVAPMHQANINFSGGSDKTTYYFSAGLTDQKGIVLKSDYQKLSLNMKANTKVNRWLTLGGMLNVVYEDEQVPHANTSQAAVQYPSIYPVYGNGGYLGGPNSVDGFENHYGILIRAFNAHPLHWLSDDDQRHRLNAAANLYAEVGIFSGLKFRSSIYGFYRRSDQKLYIPGNTGLATTRAASAHASMVRTMNYTTENLLVYNKQWDDHQIDAVAGYEANYREVYSLEGERRDYENDLIPYLSAGNLIYDTDDGANQYSLLSVLGRVHYNYKDKYMASATFRRDGSSRFGPTNKWGNFPSVSAGWRISEEEFMGSLPTISNLNLRGSYGLTGNDNFGNYRWISAMSQGRAAIGNNLVTVFSPSSVENPDLAWERTRQLNIGIDFGLWNNRIFLETDFFRSESDGLLLDVPVPSTSGFSNVFRNIGALESKGLELNLSTQNLTGAVQWNTQIVYSRIRSTITKLGPGNAPMLFQRANMNVINQMGEAPFSFYAYVYDGVYMNQQEIDADPVQYPFPVFPGDGRYRDVNGDKVLDSEDRTIIGNAQPDFTWAITNNFQYKNFDFSFMFHGSVGGDFYFADNRRSLFYHEGRNYLKEVNNRWRSEEQPGDGYHYKLSVDLHGLEKEASSYWITKGTYSRLKDVTLGYTVPPAFAEKFDLGSVRFFFNGTNLFTIQTTTAIDPENSSGSITDPSTRGVQHSPYPTAKTFALGINVGF